MYFKLICLLLYFIAWHYFRVYRDEKELRFARSMLDGVLCLGGAIVLIELMKITT